MSRATYPDEDIYPWFHKQDPENKQQRWAVYAESGHLNLMASH